MPFNRQIEIRQKFFRVHVHMVIPYHTAKFKSANSVKNIGAKPPNLMTADISGYTVYYRSLT